MTTRHFTAWMTNDTSALDQPFMDVTVIEDELVAGTPEKGAEWASNGNQVFYGATTVDARDGDAEDGCKQAEQMLKEAGWSLAGTWEAVSTSYIVTVERDEA